MASATLTEQADPTRLVLLPVTPRELPKSAQADVRQYAVIGLGNHSLPTGRSEKHYPLQGTLPGAARSGLPYVQDRWRDPKEIEDQVEDWVERKAKLTYTAEGQFGTFTVPVYVSKYQFTPTGSRGDMTYDLELVEWRLLRLRVDDGTADGDKSGDASPSDSVAGADSAADDDPPIPSTYTVQAGDSLSLIAKTVLGDSGQWQALWDANRDTIGDSPDVIFPGQVLQIPGGTAPDADTSVATAA